MSNMGYCRFTNTAQDLQDCFDHLWDDDLSNEEQRSRQRLIKIAKLIGSDTSDHSHDIAVADLTALRAENAKLREALQTIANATYSDCDGENWMKRIARAALAQAAP